MHCPFPPNQLRHYTDTYRRELLECVVPFWQQHAVDRAHGGFCMYLDRDGARYGTDKPVWLQGRAVWTFATLYNRVEPRDDWLALARHGWDFLTRHCFEPQSGKMYFLVDETGCPLRMRRYVYSEVFACLGAAALAQATGDSELRRRAIELYDTYARYLRTPGLIEPKTDPHTRPARGLAPLMCLLTMSETMLTIDDDSRYETAIDNTVAEVFEYFVKPGREAVLETVAPDGHALPGPDGRVMNPGHVIECAWFIMESARRRADDALARRAIPLLDWSFDRGWDAEHGGLLYFVDVEGKPPTQLEHDMKLWWPHCEALYASLLAAAVTGERRYAEMFKKLHDYTFAQFPDHDHGEWFGYLRRDNVLSTPLKGGLWKGPFHVPRALLYCWKLLESLAKTRT